MADQSIEIKFLENWMKEIQAKRPQSLIEKLEKKLEQAVANEEYEEAAVLRDRLNSLRGK
jgi:protein-arginine kinase activator protein McsA